jgi:methionyl-tRNA formyltransferase
MNKKTRIIFMGTPEFAVESLNILLENNYSVIAVITAPDKPAGRGYKLTPSEVKKYASEKNLQILQPTNLKDPDFLNELKNLNADLQIVVAFRMLPEAVWNMPPLGTINLHASLLPHYRGAAPINWAIINGEKETGVSTFFLQHEIDTGNIILQEKVPLTDNETAGELHDKLKTIGAKLILRTVEKIENGNFETIKQKELINNDKIKIAPKIFKKDCEINWYNKSELIHNLIRGVSPFPGAYTYVKENSSSAALQLKIYRASYLINNTNNLNTISKIETDGKTFLHIITTDGYINILELQLEGKKRLSVQDFLKGTDISKYSITQKL